MSGPQTEDGYTRIANELLEALCKIRIPGESMQILLLIFRKTYGYGKKEDRISHSQFLETGISKTHIQRAIKKLVDMNIVTQIGNKYGLIYGINKHYNSWKPLPKKVTVTNLGNFVTQKGVSELPKKGPTKEKVTKEKKKKIGPSKFTPPSHQEVQDYMQEINFDCDAQKFIDHYEAVGWVYGKNKIPIKSWKAVVRTWRDRDSKPQSNLFDKPEYMRGVR